MRRLSFALALALAGCGSEGESASPEPQMATLAPPVVMSAPNSFSVLPAGPVKDGLYAYSWTCDTEQANLSVAGVTGGSIRIEIWSGYGIVHNNVYTGGLTGQITTVTSPDGHPGAWTVRLTFEGVTSLVSITLEADLSYQPDEVAIMGAYDLDASYVYYTVWPSGPVKVTLASTIASGTVRIRIWDSLGNLVLDRSNFAITIGDTNGDSTHGAAGMWKVVIDVDAVATAGAISITHP
jgi:hypothetical protein